MEISAQFSHQKLDHTKDNAPHLVVSLKAPTLDWVTKRPALCVVPLIDLSGSMKGSKLEYAKKSMQTLVDQLQPGDIAGLIGFENRHHVFVEPATVTPELKTKLKAAIDKLRPMGGTDLCDGVLKALEVVNGLDLGPKYLKRVIMFTDGQPTNGITDQNDILRLMAENRGSVTMSAFGYGNLTNDSWSGCDQEFLTRFSQEAQGNYAYVQNPDDALTAFGRELGGLLSTYAQDIRVDVEPVEGHQIVKAVTDIPIEQNALGETNFKISDILSEETRHFVFETKVNKQPKHGIRPVNVFLVKTSYLVLTESGKRETKSVETKVKVQFVEPGEEQTTPTKEVDEIVAMAQLVRAQLEAEEKAKKGEFDAAARLMDVYTASAERRGHTHTGRVARSIRQRVQTNAAFSASEGYLRSMSYGGTRAMGLAGMDADAARDLEACNVVLSNSSMTETARQFTEAHIPIDMQVSAGPSVVMPQAPNLTPWGSGAAEGVAGASISVPFGNTLLTSPDGVSWTASPAPEASQTPVEPDKG